MNIKTFIVWFVLLAAVVLAVAADTFVNNKKQGGKQAEIPTLEREDSRNYEVGQKGWRGGGGRRGGWRGGGGRGRGWRGGGGRGWREDDEEGWRGDDEGGWREGDEGGWRGDDEGGWREGDVKLTTKQVKYDKGLSVAAWGWPGWRIGYGGWGWPGYGGWGWPGWRGYGGYGGWGWPGGW